MRTEYGSIEIKPKMQHLQLVWILYNNVSQPIYNPRGMWNGLGRYLQKYFNGGYRLIEYKRKNKNS